MSALLYLVNWREHCDADVAAKADQWQLQIQEAFGQLVLTMGKALESLPPDTPLVDAAPRQRRRNQPHKNN